MNDISRALPTRQDAQSMQANFDVALDYYTPQIADALPEHIPLARFKRVLITAIHQDRELYSADRQSLFNACVKCAQDGLYPDGREAVLKVFNTKIKRTDDKGIEHEVSVPLVTYMPMVAGIRKRLRNSGEVLSAIAEVVHRNDKFRHLKGEDARIEHEPTSLDADPGEPVGAYAIIKLANGETLREVMGAKEIEQIRKQFSRGSEGARSPWTTSRGEMWRKTVLRRCAKSAPMDSDMRRLIERDDETIDIPAASPAALPVPPRPQPEDFTESQSLDATTEADPGDGELSVEVYELTNCDGELIHCTADTVEDELLAIFTEAQKKRAQVLEAVIENNEALVTRLDLHSVNWEFAQMRGILTSLRAADAHEKAAIRNQPAQIAMVPRRVAPNPAALSPGLAPQQNPEDRPPARSPANVRRPDSGAPAPHGAMMPPPGPAPSQVTANQSETQKLKSYVVEPVYTRDGGIAYRAWYIGPFFNSLRKSADKEEYALRRAANGELMQAYYDTLAEPALSAAKKELDDIEKGDSLMGKLVRGIGGYFNRNFYVLLLSLSLAIATRRLDSITSVAIVSAGCALYAGVTSWLDSIFLNINYTIRRLEELKRS